MKLAVSLGYDEAMGTCSRIGLLRCYMIIGRKFLRFACCDFLREMVSLRARDCMMPILKFVEVQLLNHAQNKESLDLCQNKDGILTAVLDYCEVIETYSRIGLLGGHGNLQSYWTIRRSWKLTVVFYYISTIQVHLLSFPRVQSRCA